MAVQPSDVLIDVGASALFRYGTLRKRTSRRDEVAEVHSRSSVGRARNRAGTLVPWEANAPRVHFVQDENDLWVPSTLLEGARTNEFTQSGDLTHADWSATGLSARNADQAGDPEGGTTLDELVEDTSTSGHFVSQTATLTADANYALSCWVIANDRNWIRLNLQNGTDFARAWFNASTGAVGTTTSSGGGSVVRTEVEDWTDVVAGPYRVTLVGSVGSGATSIAANILMADADNSSSYTGDGSSSIYAGYAQLEDDSESASSYTPTTTAADTRAADSLYFDFTTAPQAMTVYVKFVERGTIHEATGTTVVNIGGSANETFIIQKGSSNYRIRYANGSATRVSELSAAPSLGDSVELLATLTADGVAQIQQSIGGGAVTTSSAATAADLPAAWSSQRVALNGNSAGSLNGFNAFITGPVIARGVRTMDEMRAIP